MNPFRKSLPTRFEGTWIQVSWPTLVKIGRREVAEKSSGFGDKSLDSIV